VYDWSTPTLGSTDYFNACSEAMGTPKNFNGEQPADFGVGYVGFYMLALEDYREYIQAPLSTTLVKGVHYTLSFYVSLAERSDFAIQEFGVRFSEFPLAIETTKVLSSMHLSKMEGDTSNYLEIGYSHFYDDAERWTLITSDFMANGTENFIIIGNFKDNKRTRHFQTKRKMTKGSYYYLDMVSVHPASSGTNPNTNSSSSLSSSSKLNLISNLNPGPNLNPNADSNIKIDTSGLAEIATFQTDSLQIFKNVLFHFNEATLRDSDQKELQKMVLFLKENSSVSIKIIGHTDAIGSPGFNEKLSLSRAKTVANHFLEHGISKHRIQFESVGSSQPLATNKTEAGRMLNRRVELKLIN
ncbi:MAG: OmpA family protein, partial [Maribacter sp.]